MPAMHSALRLQRLLRICPLLLSALLFTLQPWISGSISKPHMTLLLSAYCRIFPVNQLQKEFIALQMVIITMCINIQSVPLLFVRFPWPLCNYTNTQCWLFFCIIFSPISFFSISRPVTACSYVLFSLQNLLETVSCIFPLCCAS